jgi:hypothetical protein
MIQSKKSGFVFGMIALGSLVAVPSAFASGKLVKACKEDLAKYSCKASTDHEAHECLEKNEKQGEKNEGFTEACYKAHEAFEKKSGKGEKSEEHHDESAEHKQ